MSPADYERLLAALPALRDDALANAAGQLARRAVAERRRGRTEAATWFESARAILAAESVRRAGADASPVRELAGLRTATAALPPRDLIALAIECQRYLDDVEAHASGPPALFTAALLHEIRSRLQSHARRADARQDLEPLSPAVERSE